MGDRLCLSWYTTFAGFSRHGGAPHTFMFDLPTFLNRLSKVALLGSQS